MKENIVTNPTSPVESSSSPIVLPEKSREKRMIKILISLLVISLLTVGGLGTAYLYQLTSRSSSSNSSTSLISSSSSPSSFDVDTSNMKELRNEKYGFAFLYSKDLIYSEDGVNAGSALLFSGGLSSTASNLKNKSMAFGIYDRREEGFNTWIDRHIVDSYSEDTSGLDGIYFVRSNSSEIRFDFKGHEAVLFSELLMSIEGINFMVEDGKYVVNVLYTFSDQDQNLREQFLDTVSSLSFSSSYDLGISSRVRNDISAKLDNLLK